MPYVPPKVVASSLSRKLYRHLGPPRRGKVRDTYQIPGHPDKLLVVATDRISIFDFVLGSLVKDKGAVLTAMTVLWLTQVFPHIKNHLLAWGNDIDDVLPRDLFRDPDLQSRGLVVQALQMIPVECIVRSNVTGTGWVAYKNTGEVCGIKLPPGLHDGSKLDNPIFTPTTKAEEGHDEHLDAKDVVEQYGELLCLASLGAFNAGAVYAEQHGFMLADTKFEFGNNDAGELILADEVLTPDSSRLWLKSDWEIASGQNRSPAGYDKELVRGWGKTVETPFPGTNGKIKGLQNLDAKNLEHKVYIGEVAIPDDVTESCTLRYRTAFEILNDGRPLEDFQYWSMGIRR